MQLTIANFLTILRILLIVPIVVCYLTPFQYNQTIAAALFACAAMLDWVDGYVARKMHEESSSGAVLDHIADKILISSVLVVITYQLHSLIVTICSLLIIARELFIAGLREYMAEKGASKTVEVNIFGKIKTTLQMLTILLILVSEPFAIPAFIGEVVMIVVVCITIVSGWNYLPRKK